MIRSLIAAAFVLLIASPAAAQSIGGCAIPPTNQIDKSTDRAALQAGIDCIRKAQAIGDASIARRQKRLDALAAASPAASKLAGLVAEGDSITAEWGGNYAGLWRKAHPSAKFTTLAVSGARISDPSGGNGLVQRLPGLLAAKPAVVSILIGANDGADGQYATPQAWLDALWGVTAQVRASGAKVAVGTVLPLCFDDPSMAAYVARHAQRRPIYNAAIRAAIGSKIDAVFETADALGGDRAPCTDRKLWKDGIHPSDSNGKDGGQDRVYAIYAPVVDRLLAGAPAAGVSIPAAGQGDSVPPPLGGTVAAGLPAIASNFVASGLIEPAFQTGVLGAIAPTAAPDVVGAFRFVCMAGHVAKDDPVVFPGQPGKSHLHQFFGNTEVNAFSTYATLRTSGDSTCGNRLNRSAYWIPAMLNGKGGVVRPDYVSIYYKRRPSADPECQRMGKACVALPRGLRFVFGFDMISGQAPTGHGYFNCQGNGAQEGHYADIVEAAAHCQIGSQLGLIINAPNCWNGKDLDSPNHRDHVAYTSYGSWGYEKCPATHPYVIPTFTLGGWYTVGADLDRSGTWDVKRPTWSLSSDDMSAMGHGQQRPGTTLHGDWFGAWDDPTLAAWTDNCINKLLNCNGGNLGNGWQMKQEGPPLTYKADPRVVPAPAGTVMAGMVH